MAKQRDRTPLDKLLKHWQRASPLERSQFLAQVTSGVDFDGRPDGLPEIPRSAAAHRQPIANGRYLLPQTVQRIERIIIARRITPADVMQEMGFDRNRASLTRALARGASLRLAVVAALERWIDTYEGTPGPAAPENDRAVD